MSATKKHICPLYSFERETGELVEFFWSGGAEIRWRVDGDDKTPLTIRRSKFDDTPRENATMGDALEKVRRIEQDHREEYAAILRESE